MKQLDRPACRPHGGSSVRSPWILGLALFCLLGSGGCATKIPYTPQLDLVERRGPARAMEELAAVVKRVLLPKVTPELVKVTEDHLRYDFPPEVIEYLFWSYIEQGPKTIYWASLDRIDLYDNHRVFMYGAGGHEQGWLHFHSREDAMAFIHLALSFRERWRATHRPE